MAEEKPCTVLSARESKFFNVRVNYSATKHLSGDECIDVDIPIPAATGLICTTKYWPNWHSTNYVKISVVISRIDDQHHQQQQRHKLVAAHIALPARTGLAPPTVKVKRETDGKDCKEGMVKREPVPADCKEEGVSLTVWRGEVETKCVVDGHFTVICVVAVSKAWPPLPLPALPRLEHDILMTADLTDVSFQVDGETFRAHRLVLAARSPVFKAMLFGETMAETESHKASSIIAIQDTKACTFKSMLHYMYHGCFQPAVAPETACQMLEFQNLYVAAHKYGLDTLKQTCEEILCASVTTDTVLSSLQFAEDHKCLKLKSRCLDFLAVGENFKAVAVTNEYIDLMTKAPPLLDHVQNRFKRRRLL